MVGGLGAGLHDPDGDSAGRRRRHGERRGGTTGDIRIEPADLEREIVDGVPVVVDYRAFVSEGGVEREVTSEVTWSVGVTALGSFSGARFTSATDRGGRTDVLAQLGGLRGSTTLTLRISRVVITGGAPADAPSRFGAARIRRSRRPSSTRATAWPCRRTCARSSSTTGRAGATSSS
ncbi:MAG: hypothetical protein M5U28_19110 [Sandaracinaceae bacterium]|nr:hypothetical protein [Sandaracinaceae bacterium]